MDNSSMCAFCLKNNKLRVPILYEDDTWYIVDMEKGSINNAVMAIPKRHIETPFKLNQTEWQSLQLTIQTMKQLVDNREMPQGYNLGWNIGSVGGQHVFHAHLHLLARYEDEPLAGKGIRYAFKQDENKRRVQ